MAEQHLGATRLFANLYQIIVCDDPSRPVSDDEKWDEEGIKIGFAGGVSFRIIGTKADLNDIWVELVASDAAPSLDDWHRITCVHFHSASGKVHVMSLSDDTPAISADIDDGDYSIYVAGQNLGIDQLGRGEKQKLTDAELAARRDLEWYRIFVVPGIPSRTGRLNGQGSLSAFL